MKHSPKTNTPSNTPNSSLSSSDKALIGFTLVAETGMLEFIEQVNLHVDAGWEMAGEVKLFKHNHWEELEPQSEKRFCLQMVMYESAQQEKESAEESAQGCLNLSDAFEPRH